MPLRQKSLLILTISLITSIVILFGTASLILVQGYTRQEKLAAAQNVERAENGLNMVFDQLSSTIVDWSAWEDTYQFIANPTQGYIDTNLQNSTFAYLKINVLQYYDLRGKLIYSKLVDLGGTNVQPITGPDNEIAKHYPHFLQVLNKGSLQTGIILLDNKPTLVISAPITNNDQSGPYNGFLIMGRFIDKSLVDTLSKQTKTTVTIFPYPLDKNNQILRDLGRQLESGVVYPSKKIGKNLFAGYTLLRDINGSPVAIIQVAFPMDIYNQGITTLIYLFSVLALLVMIVLFIFYYLLDRFFFKRVMNISNDVKRINELRQPEARIQNLIGNDEISSLGKSINVLLSTLEEIQDSYKTLVVNQGEGLALVDDKEKIIFANPAADTIFHLKEGSLVGRNMLEFIKGADVGKLKQETSQRKHGKKSTYELELHLDDGTMVPVLITANPKYDEDGNFIATYGIFRDITDLKNTQQILVESEAKFRSFIEQSQVGIILLDEEGKVIEWNPTLQEITGLKREIALNNNFVDVIEKLLPIENRTEIFTKKIKSVYKKLVSHGDYDQAKDPIEFNVHTTKGERIAIDLIPFPINTAKGVMVGGVFYDKTERKRMEKAEKEQRNYIEALLDTAEVLNGTLDLDNVMEKILENTDRVIHSDAGVILTIENGLLRVMRSRGYQERGLPDITKNPPFTLTSMANMNWMFETGQPLSIPDTDQYPEWKPLPENTWVKSYVGVPLKIRDKVAGFISLFSEKAGAYSAEDAERLKPFANQAAVALENARLYKETQQKADTDELTGLKNRRSFFEIGAREIERATRFGHPLSALMIDLDNFKQVNDTFGHPVGDLILKELAELFKTKLRNVDLIARYGGDEFIVLLPENDARSAMDVSNRLRSNLEQLVVETVQGKARVTASFGIASLDNHMTSLSALIEHADRALYNAKRFGKNRVVSNTERSI